MSKRRNKEKENHLRTEAEKK